MPCGCKSSGERYQVIAGGKVVFVTGNENTANAVSRRYKGSTVEHKPAAKAS